MRFPPSFLDDIRDRLRISEVVGARVQFDRKKTNAAKGDYWACCPFHGEKTPSFHCEDRKGRYHCFGCGVSGDHFRFLTELDGLAFPEVVERLADQAGLPMPIMDRHEQEREEKRATLFDVMEMAAGFFQDQLQTSTGAKARAYLRDRGLSVDVQQHFGLGFAPDSRNLLKEFLASKGVGKDQIEACGLVVHGENIAVSYDRFRDRIMFPIPDARGRVIAFGGRAMSPDAMAKYLNSPETELFHKSNVLFNFARARKTSYERKQVIAVEGYMDVIALHSAGFTNAVAPLGTALTERQMELLWRMHAEPVLCFDGDSAGQKAAHRAVDMILPNLQPGRSVRFAMLPEGLDPDDLIQQNGPQAFEDILNSTLPLADMVWDRELHTGAALDSPERKAEFEQRIKLVVGNIRDENVRRHYGQNIAERLSAYFGGGRGKNNWNRSGRRGAGGKNSWGRADKKNTGSRAIGASPSLINSSLIKKRTSLPPLREGVLVMAVAMHPALSVMFFDEIVSLKLEHSGLQQLHACIVDALAAYDGNDDCMDRDELRQMIIDAGQGEIFERYERQLRDNRIWQALPQAAFEDAIDGWKQAYALYLRNRTLHRELKTAERALAQDDSEENLERLLQIHGEIERDDGTEALIEGFGVSSGRPSKGF
ncbi:MAG: DNA primase [Hyphomicrobiales bacterium]|nr:DNA primase [Hyphomicrobiales bacterium]